MSWTAICLIVLIFGMMAWPIVLLKPNSRQQQLIKQRAAIAKLGISFKVTPPKLPDNQNQEYATLARSMGFHLDIANSVLDSRFTAVRSQYSGEWLWINQKRPQAALMQAMLQQYQQLPDCVLAVEQGPTGSTIYALESKVETDNLLSVLTPLNRLIEQAIPRQNTH